MKQKLIAKIDVLIIFILFACFQCGCATNNRHKYQAYQDMKEFILDEYNRKGWYLLFFETQNENEIIYEEAMDLQYTLRALLKIKSKDIDSYFKNMMTGKTIFSCGDFGRCFTLSTVIMDEYKKKKDIYEFLEKHAEYDDSDDIICNRYFINPSFSYDERLTIAYLLYLNNIYTLIDDYTGYFISYVDLVCVVKDGVDLIEIEE